MKDQNLFEPKALDGFGDGDVGSNQIGISNLALVIHELAVLDCDFDLFVRHGHDHDFIVGQYPFFDSLGKREAKDFIAIKLFVVHRGDVIVQSFGLVLDAIGVDARGRRHEQSMFGSDIVVKKRRFEHAVTLLASRRGAMGLVENDQVEGRRSRLLLGFGDDG